MASFILSPAAQNDLEGIWDYTVTQWGAQQAETYIRTIEQALNAIASKSIVGRAIEDIRPGYLKYRVGKHVLYYRLPQEGTVDVIRILHGRMDVERHLTSDTDPASH